MPQPLPESQTVSENGFNDCWLASQISISFLVVHTLLGKLPISSPIPRLQQQAHLTVEFLRVCSQKKRRTFDDISSHLNLFKLYSRCYNHPHLKCTTSSLCLINWATDASAWPVVQTQYLYLARRLPRVLPSTGATQGRESAWISSVTPWPLHGSQVIARNDFEDRWLAPQITTNFSNVLRPCLHITWVTSHEVTHPKITPQLAHLAIQFLRVGYQKRGCTSGDINSHSNPFMLYLRCYNLSPYSLPLGRSNVVFLDFQLVSKRVHLHWFDS